MLVGVHVLLDLTHGNRNNTQLAANLMNTALQLCWSDSVIALRY